MNRYIPIAFAALVATQAGSALAQLTIDHNKALLGSVTPGDTPGYPITLSVPGHYKLMSNLLVPASVGGIEIAASNVTVDLNGFTVSSSNACTQNQSTYMVSCTRGGSSSESGVYVNAAGLSGTQVRNGTVRGFDGSGVLAYGIGGLVVGVRVSHTGANGIVVGEAGRISDSLAVLNRNVGLTTFRGRIENSISMFNGIALDAIGSVVTESSVVRNRLVGDASYLRGTQFTGNNDQPVGYISMGGNAKGSTPF